MALREVTLIFSSMLFACTLPVVANTWFCGSWGDGSKAFGWQERCLLAGKFSDKVLTKMYFDERAKYPQTDMKCDVFQIVKIVGTKWQKLESTRHIQDASTRENQDMEMERWAEAQRSRQEEKEFTCYLGNQGAGGTERFQVRSQMGQKDHIRIWGELRMGWKKVENERLKKS